MSRTKTLPDGIYTLVWSDHALQRWDERVMCEEDKPIWVNLHKYLQFMYHVPEDDKYAYRYFIHSSQEDFKLILEKVPSNDRKLNVITITYTTPKSMEHIKDLFN